MQKHSPAPPGETQQAGFGLGSPAYFFSKSGEKRAPGGATGNIFVRRRTKSALGGFLGGWLELLLAYAEKTGLDVETVGPSLVFGPLLQPTANTSSLFLIKYLK